MVEPGYTLSVSAEGCLSVGGDQAAGRSSAASAMTDAAAKAVREARIAAQAALNQRKVAVARQKMPESRGDSSSSEEESGVPSPAPSSAPLL